MKKKFDPRYVVSDFGNKPQLMFKVYTHFCRACSYSFQDYIFGVFEKMSDSVLDDDKSYLDTRRFGKRGDERIYGDQIF
jgi:hypothetical protein